MISCLRKRNQKITQVLLLRRTPLCGVGRYWDNRAPTGIKMTLLYKLLFLSVLICLLAIKYIVYLIYFCLGKADVVFDFQIRPYQAQIMIFPKHEVDLLIYGLIKNY